MHSIAFDLTLAHSCSALAIYQNNEERHTELLRQSSDKASWDEAPAVDRAEKAALTDWVVLVDVYAASVFALALALHSRHCDETEQV